MKPHSIISLLLFVFLLTSCKKNTDLLLPLITTTELKAPGDLSIIAGGRIYEEGSDAITEVGVCWSKTDNAPKISGEHLIGIIKDKIFSCTIENLSASSDYFVCAYATNKYGTTYGTAERINSGVHPSPPTVITQSLLTLSTTSVSIASRISSPLSLVQEAGICWNRNGIPTVEDNKITAPTFATGSYTCNIEGLQANEIIVVRAFARSKGGVSYGAETIVRTYFGTMIDHEGNQYFTTLINGKEWMAEDLRSAEFVNGVEIPLLNDNFSWQSGNLQAARCFESSEAPVTGNTGFFYNYKAATSIHQIAPTGWHLPSKEEYENLFAFFDWPQFAPSCLRRASPNIWGLGFVPNKLTAFDATLDGERTSDGYYYGAGATSYFITNTPYNANNMYMVTINPGGTDGYVGISNIGVGAPIRLVKD